jgi:hypothetical protein
MALFTLITSKVKNLKIKNNSHFSTGICFKSQGPKQNLFRFDIIK